MQTFWRDLGSGVRQLGRQPIASFAAVLSLAAALGAGTLLFALLNTLLLSPVADIPRSDRLVDIGRTSQGQGFDTLSLPNLRDLREQLEAAQYVYGHSTSMASLETTNGPIRVAVRLVTGDYFEAMQQQPRLGRLLRADDDAPNAPERVAVIGAGAFERLYGNDPTALGRVLRVNGVDLEIVGITEPGFDHPGLGSATDLFVPMGLAGAFGRLPNEAVEHRGARWLFGGARLADGATLTGIDAELDTLGARLRDAWPDRNRQIGYRAEPMRAIPAPMRMPAGVFIGLLFALAGIVLLVATSNVAALLLARGETRRRELAMRFVLGARRGHLVRQLLIETLVLVGTAGAVGVLLASVGRSLLRQVDLPLPIPIDLGVDLAFSWPVVAFVLTGVLLATLLAGLMPAIRSTRMSPAAVLAASGNALAGQRSWFRLALTGGQVACSLVLLVMAGLFVHAIQRAGGIDPGFETESVYTADVDLRSPDFEGERAALIERYAAQLDADPMIESAGAAAVVPLTMSRMGFGGFVSDSGELLDADVNVVGGRFFETLAIPVRGRVFDERDGAGAEAVAIINESLARRLAPDGEVLGRAFEFGEVEDSRPLRIVGVTPDGRYSRLSETGTSFLYLPLAQLPMGDVYMFVRSPAPFRDIADRLERLQRTIDPRLLPPRVQSLDEVARVALLPQRIAGVLAASLGVLGGLLTALGLYGMLSHLVASHTREVGVRLALGASPARIRRRLVWIGLRPVLWGTAIGLIAAAIAARLLDGFLYGVQGADGLAFLFALVAISVISILALAGPARRAARIHPNEALRYE